jgi:similar to spore coat protein
MEPQALAPHESMEIHEMLNFKTICLAKSKLMQGLSFSEELKELMQKDVQQSIRAVQELAGIYQRAPFAQAAVRPAEEATH